MEAARRASPRLTRSVRVPTPGIRVRLNGVHGDLLNVSATGALVRLRRELPVGTDCSVSIDVNDRRIDLSGRVIRCERMGITLPGGAVMKQTAYAIGVMFMHMSAAAMQEIAKLCGGAIAIEELPFRILFVSDDPDVNAGINKAISSAGYQVRLVTEPREVIAAAQEGRADAAIVNLRLDRDPSMWWVLEVIECESVPIIALGDAALLSPGERRRLEERRVEVVPLSSAPQQLLALLARIFNPRG